MWVIGDKIYEYRLNNMKLGKLVRNNKKAFRVENVSYDVLWQVNRALALIIRDYLRFFIDNSPAVGNCVLPAFPGDIEGRKKWFADLDKDEEINTARWKELVNNTADEFDVLANSLGFYGSEEFEADDNTIREMTEKAFKDLAYIFMELCW